VPEGVGWGPPMAWESGVSSSDVPTNAKDRDDTVMGLEMTAGVKAGIGPPCGQYFAEWWRAVQHHRRPWRRARGGPAACVPSRARERWIL